MVGTRDVDNGAAPRRGRLGLVLTVASVVAAGTVLLLLVASGRNSPVRGPLALGFLLFGPGLVFAELLGVRDLALRLTVAFGASVALDTLVAVSLVYAGHFSAGIGVAIILMATACSALAAVLWAPS